MPYELGKKSEDSLEETEVTETKFLDKVIKKSKNP